MGLESGTWVNDLVKTNPASSDDRSQGANHLRLIKTVAQNTFPNANRAFYFPNATQKSADFSVTAAQMNQSFVVDATAGTVTATLPTLTSSDDGWACFIYSKNLTHTITIAPPSGTINGAASVSFSLAGQLAKAWWDGSTWRAQFDNVVDIADSTALTAPAKDDSLLIYDLSATLNKKIANSDFFKVIDAFPEIVTDSASSVAMLDELALFDASASGITKATVQHFWNSLNALIAVTTVDLTNDTVSTYNAADSAADKIPLYKLNGFSSQLLHVREQQSSGVSTTTNNTPGAWQTTVLNTAITNEISGASLSVNQVILPAGTYYCEGNSVHSDTGLVKSRLRNTTDGATLLVGRSAQNEQAPIRGRFTLTGTKTVELQEYFSSGSPTGPSSTGEVEVYGELFIWKIK